MEKKSLMRVNARIGANQNDWLDKFSAESGISKSSLIQLAVESYMQQKESISAIQELTSKIESLEGIIDKAENMQV